MAMVRLIFLAYIGVSCIAGIAVEILKDESRFANPTVSRGVEITNVFRKIPGARSAIECAVFCMNEEDCENSHYSTTSKITVTKT